MNMLPHIHTLPLLLFVLFDVVYILFCIFLYIQLLKAVRQKTKSKPAQRMYDYEKIGIVALTLFSVYLMNKWIILQMINGCTPTFFWNHACYDLNSLCRAWLMISVLIGINAIALSIVLDLRAQTKRIHKK